MEIREKTIHFGNGIKRVVGYDVGTYKTWINISYIDGNDRYTYKITYRIPVNINLDSIYFVNPNTNEK